MRPEDKDATYWTLLLFALWFWTFVPAIGFHEHQERSSGLATTRNPNKDPILDDLRRTFPRRRMKLCAALASCNCLLVVGVSWVVDVILLRKTFPEGLEFSMLLLWASELVVAILIFVRVENQRQQRAAKGLASKQAAKERSDVFGIFPC